MPALLAGQILRAGALAALFDKIMADPVATGGTGTATTGTTETRDDILGVYTYSAAAGRRYRATLSGLLLSGGVVNDLAIVTIRDGGVSTPTAASTLIANSQWKCQLAGGGGQTSCFVSATFTPAAGTRTLAVFTKLSVGTGPITPLGLRELYVEDIGAA
jgi:hypothetical protein